MLLGHRLSLSDPGMESRLESVRERFFGVLEQFKLLILRPVLSLEELTASKRKRNGFLSRGRNAGAHAQSCQQVSEKTSLILEVEDHVLHPSQFRQLPISKADKRPRFRRN